MRGPSLSSANKQEIMIRHRPCLEQITRGAPLRQIAHGLSPPRLHKVNQAPNYASHMSCTSFCLVTLACSLAMLRSFLKAAFATPCRSHRKSRQGPAPRASSADQRAGKTRAPDQARAHALGAAAPPDQMSRPHHAWPCTRAESSDRWRWHVPTPGRHSQSQHPKAEYCTQSGAQPPAIYGPF